VLLVLIFFFIIFLATFTNAVNNPKLTDDASLSSGIIGVVGMAVSMIGTFVYIFGAK
jgi:uncharacterized membrane protein (DUF485 family)